MPEEGILDVHPRVEGDLLIPAPSRVELLTQVAYLLDEPVLDVHMDVFEIVPEGKGALPRSRSLSREGPARSAPISSSVRMPILPSISAYAMLPSMS